MKIEQLNIKKNPLNIFLILVVIGLLLPLISCNNNSPTENYSLAPHKPDVYIDGFPVVRIDVDADRVIDWDSSGYDLLFFRENWHPAVLNIENTHQDFLMTDVDVFARGRGNSTWWSFGEKRPIRFRFPNNEWQAVLDSEYVGRDWVTFANAADPSHLRNFAAYYLGSLLSFHWTPQTWFIHLYLDGDYRGVYMLLDEREAIEGRGDLYLHEDPTISEFMIEFDIRTRDSDEEVNTHWVDVRGPWDIRWPNKSEWMSEVNNAHALYVEDFLTRIDNAILAGDEATLRSLVDFETFIDYYLVHEFLKNQDTRWSSMFFQIRGQGEERRLYSGPIWDFDLSSGSTSIVSDSIGSHATLSYEANSRMDWYYHLMKTEWFKALVYERWTEIRDIEVTQTLKRIEYMASNFEDEFERDFNRWNRRSHVTYDWASSIQTRKNVGPREQANYLINWLEQRIEWLDIWLAE